MVVSLFCTSEHGVLIQDSFSTPDQYSTFIGVEVPYHYFIRKVNLFFSLVFVGMATSFMRVKFLLHLGGGVCWGKGEKCDLDRIQVRDLVIVKGVIPFGCSRALECDQEREKV